MPEYLNEKEAFSKCKKEGRFIVTEEIDIEKVKATLTIAEGDVEPANILKKNLPKKSNQWNSVYKLYYDALHELVESFLRFEKIKLITINVYLRIFVKNIVN
jgi:DNA polymerase III delta prime subunit